MQKASNPPDTPQTSPKNGAKGSILSRFLASREISVFLVQVLICCFMATTTMRENFFKPDNVREILFQVSMLAIFAIGETIVIITGGIDLSLGSLIAFSGMLLATLVTNFDTALYTPLAIALAVGFTLLASGAIGLLHATLIHRVRLPAFVVTLVSLLVLRSQSYVMNSRNTVPVDSEKIPFFGWLTNGKLFDETLFAVPIPFVLMLTIAITVHIVLTKTHIGRYLYSIGSNEVATRLSGVNVFRVKLVAYGVSALLGGVAGMLYMGYDNQGNPVAGQSYELNAVAAAVVGGANLAGGQGTVLGTVLGALLLITIRSVIVLVLPQPDIWDGTVTGGVLLLAVLATALQQRGKTRTN